MSKYSSMATKNYLKPSWEFMHKTTRNGGMISNTPKSIQSISFFPKPITFKKRHCVDTQALLK